MPPKKREPAKEKKSSWKTKILRELQERKQREEKIKRELAATQKNYKIVENTWRKIFRKFQTPLIKEDAEAFRRRFEHTVDIKNRIIVLLREALDEEEERRVQSDICQSVAMKQLLDMYVNQLNDLRQRNKVLVKKLCLTGRGAIRKEKQRNREEIEHQHAIAYIAEMTQIHDDLQCEAENIARLENVVSQSTAQVQQLYTLLEKKLEKIWNQIINVVAEYQQRTEDIHKAYLRLKGRDEKITAEIRRISERIHHLQLLIKILQDKERRTKEEQASLDGLKEERKDFIYAYSRLRDYLRQDREGDAKRLTDLVVRSNESLKWLSEIEKKGERILSLAKLCQLRQTEFETVIINGQIHFTEEMTDNVSESGQETDLTHKEQLVKEAVDICKTLDNFWRRVGRAQITRNVLAEECESLKAENKMLIMKVYDYLAEITLRGQASNQHTATKGFSLIEASHIYKHLI